MITFNFVDSTIGEKLYLYKIRGIESCKPFEINDEILYNIPTDPTCENYIPIYGIIKGITQRSPFYNVYELYFPYINTYRMDMRVLQYMNGYDTINYEGQIVPERDLRYLDIIKAIGQPVRFKIGNNEYNGVVVGNDHLLDLCIHPGYDITFVDSDGNLTMARISMDDVNQSYHMNINDIEVDRLKYIDDKNDCT